MNAENGCVRPGIGDLSSDDVSHSGFQHEVMVPLIPAQFRHGHAFREPHPYPVMTREELGEGIFGCEMGDVVRSEFDAGTEEISPIDPSGTRVSDDIRRSNRAHRLGERLQDGGPQPGLKRRVMDCRDDAPERITVSRHVDTERSKVSSSETLRGRIGGATAKPRLRATSLATPYSFIWMTATGWYGVHPFG